MPVLAQLLEKYPNDVQVTFRHFPLPNHNLSFIAATAAEAAGNQGKFWEYDEALFGNQSEWVTLSEDQFNTYLADLAQKVGLNTDQFKADFADAATKAKVTAALKRAEDAGIDHTPYLVINGRPYNGPASVGMFESLLKLFQLKDRQVSECPPMVIDPKKQYTATIQTEKGDIVIQLFPDKAPLTVNSFVFLAQRGWFDNITFHRVMQNFVAQTGDPSGSGMGNPGYYFKNESSDLTYDKEGVVGMANAGPDTNGSQFFITLSPAHNLDGNFTIFGQVIEGMDVVRKLTLRDPSKNPDAPAGDLIKTITINVK